MGRLVLAVVLLSTLVCAKSPLWTWLQFGDSQEDYDDYEEVVSESKAYAESEAKSYKLGNHHKREYAESKPYDDGVDDDDDYYYTPKPGGSGPGADTSTGGSTVTEGPLTTETSDSQTTSKPGTGRTDESGTGGKDKPGTGGTDKPGTGGTDNPGTGGKDNPGTGGKDKPDEADDDFDKPDYLDMSDTPSKDKAVDRARTAFYGDKKGEMLLPDGYGVRYGAGTKNPALRWPNGTIPYVIDSSLDQIKKKISTAIDTYHNETCIKFVPRSNEKNYIQITKGQGCSSFVGMNGGKQDVSIGSGCEYLGTILHELGHAIGLYHEHQRSDRDKYITVYIGNVTQGAEDQFKPINPNDEAIYTDFDYKSIMIYGNYAFSKEPGKLQTMVANNSSQKLEDPYDKQNLDASDLYTVRNLYQCNGTTTNNV